jgi:hypothetical protein
MGLDEACTMTTDGQPAVGSVSGGSQAYFAFKALAGVGYAVNIDIKDLPMASKDTAIVIVDEAGTELASNDDGHPPDEIPIDTCSSNSEEACASYLQWSAPATAIYYIAVQEYGGSEHKKGTFVVKIDTLDRGAEEIILLQPNGAPLQIETSCFAPGADDTGNQLPPACEHALLQRGNDDVRQLAGASNTFSVAIDAVAGATFEFNVQLLSRPSCHDIGRADGMADAYCDPNRIPCEDFGPGTPTEGLCDRSCGFCSVDDGRRRR